MEDAGYRLLELLAKGAGEIFGDKTFNSRVTMRNRYLGVLLLFSLCACFMDGCVERNTGEHSEGSSARLSEELERANRLAVDRSQLQIEGYVRRRGLHDMSKLSSGMYVGVSGRAKGAQFVEGERAQVAYRLELLDGTIIRELDSTRAETLVLGGRERTAGLDILITMMAPGQEAIGIVPSHLGYGLSGDGSKVPPHACLVYTVTWLRRLP